jgi:hypothetical protein
MPDMLSEDNSTVKGIGGGIASIGGRAEEGLQRSISKIPKRQVNSGAPKNLLPGFTCSSGGLCYIQ